MDNNTSLVPADFGQQVTKLSNWQRPGGTLAKILTVVAGCGGLYALYLILPSILAMMTNAFYVALLAIALYAIVSIVTNKKFRRLVSTVFFLICRKLTSLAIETNPLAIIRRHIEELKTRVQKISEAMGKFRGSIRSIEQEKLKSEKELEREMELLDGYKKAGKMQDATVHSNQAVRLKELIAEYTATLAKMKLYYEMLKDLQHYTELKVQDEENEVNILAKKYANTEHMSEAFSEIMNIVNSNTDDIDEYLYATDYMYQEIDMRIGAMDDVLLSTDSLITQIGVNNAIAINKADDMLSVYEKYGVEGFFMTEEQRKALPASASGTTPVSELSGWTESEKELLKVRADQKEIVENVTRKYI